MSGVKRCPDLRYEFIPDSPNTPVQGVHALYIFEPGQPRVHPFDDMRALARFIIDQGYFDAEGFRVQYGADDDVPNDDAPHLVRRNGSFDIRNVHTLEHQDLEVLADEFDFLTLDW